MSVAPGRALRMAYLVASVGGVLFFVMSVTLLGIWPKRVLEAQSAAMSRANALGMSQQSLSTFAVYVVGAIVGLVLGLRAWPALGRTLLAYAFAARVPVVLVMLAAILGNWGTHYDVPPPGLPAMAPLSKWLLIGVLPQMTIWIWFTVVVGSLFGILAAAVARRGRAAA